MKNNYIFNFKKYIFINYLFIIIFYLKLAKKNYII